MTEADWCSRLEHVESDCRRLRRWNLVLLLGGIATVSLALAPKEDGVIDATTVRASRFVLREPDGQRGHADWRFSERGPEMCFVGPSGAMRVRIDGGSVDTDRPFEWAGIMVYNREGELRAFAMVEETVHDGEGASMGLLSGSDNPAKAVMYFQKDEVSMVIRTPDGRSVFQVPK